MGRMAKGENHSINILLTNLKGHSSNISLNQH